MHTVCHGNCWRARGPKVDDSWENTCVGGNEGREIGVTEHAQPSTRDDGGVRETKAWNENVKVFPHDYSENP